MKRVAKSHSNKELQNNNIQNVSSEVQVNYFLIF